MGRTPALILLAGLLACAGSVFRPGAAQEPPRAGVEEPAQEPAEAPPHGPPPRAPIAGLQGFDSLAVLTYAADPGRPHQLRATYAFPERARWWIGVDEGAMAERQMRYRLGARLHGLEPGTARSSEYRGPDRRFVLAQLELRRALFLWPDGFEWTGAGAERSASLGEGLGSLQARFARAGDERPVGLAWRDAQGLTVDEYRALEWQSLGKRTWPRAAELWHAGELVWSERVTSIDPAARFLDQFFLPPDQREGPQGALEGAGVVRQVDVPPICARRVELPADTSWEQARARRVELIALHAPELAALGHDLDDKASFEISDALEPVAVLLRLVRVPAQAPEGFRSTPPRTGLMTFVIGFDALRDARLADLRAALPVGSRAEAPYLRYDPADARGPVLIALPLVPAD